MQSWRVLVLLLSMHLMTSSVYSRIAVPTSDYNAVTKTEAQQDMDLEVPTSRQLSDSSTSTDDTSDSDAEEDSSLPWALGAVRVMRKVYIECREEDLSSCLKVQLIRALDRVSRSAKKIPIMAGVTLEQDSDHQLDGKPLSKEELEASLPRSLPERERSLDKLILDKIFNIFQSYSLRFKFPSMAELSTSSEDARRRKGQNGLMALGMLLAGSLLPMKFGMLAMLAGKALMLSKLALVISTLMAVRNMGSGGSSSGGGSAHH